MKRLVRLVTPFGLVAAIGLLVASLAIAKGQARRIDALEMTIQKESPMLEAEWKSGGIIIRCRTVFRSTGNESETEQQFQDRHDARVAMRKERNPPDSK